MVERRKTFLARIGYGLHPKSHKGKQMQGGSFGTGSDQRGSKDRLKAFPNLCFSKACDYVGAWMFMLGLHPVFPFFCILLVYTKH